MTLIVGIKCANGIVLAADTRASTDASGILTTADDDFSAKIMPIENKVLLGFSGQVGMGQEMKLAIEKMLKDGHGRLGKTELEIRKNVAKELWNICSPWYDREKTTSQQSGVFNSLFTALIARFEIIQDDPRLHLYEIDHNCNIEESTDAINYAAIGSGKIAADFFLKFLKDILWRGHLPSLEMGKIAATWTIQHAIDCNTFGVGGHVKLAVMEVKDCNIAISELSPEMQSPIDRYISSAENDIRKSIQNLLEPSEDDNSLDGLQEKLEAAERLSLQEDLKIDKS